MGSHPRSGKIVPIRMLIDVKTPFAPVIHSYAQETDSNHELKLMSWTNVKGPAHGERVYRLHSIKQEIQPKRYRAHLLGTTYCYDYTTLFQEAARQKWIKCEKNVPELLMTYTELSLSTAGDLTESQSPPGILD